MAEAAAAVKKSNGSGAEPFQVKRGSRMRLREASCNDWLAIVPNNIKPEDLTKPNVFSLLGKELKTYDLIRVFPEDRSYFAELVVLDSGLGFVDVALLCSYALPKVEQRSDSTLDGYELVQDAVERTWHAIRKLDRQPMFRLEGIKTKNELVHRLTNDATVRQR